ncbi:glycosyltransferase family 4 protein [Tardiphaga sp.]|uniref:glycosyltransferase family 4 protein n=1 Tax=Tardiphaga sp. TaxID=1926292 RepID=UPI002605C174|nr:glycosyltransferase family 4 protein [Tardiphaga sp.]MDB5616831.1 glycosyl transferase [Tardiphaga sp.]
MNILLLTSEFAPVQGGIGTYASEIATAATALGASVTVVAPDYTKGADSEDLALTYPVQRFNGGLHSMRDTPAKISLARGLVRQQNYDVIHAADWPFFIPVALSRRLTKARLLMTVHGTEINETQTPLKRFAIGATNVFGERTEVIANSSFTRELFRTRFAMAAERVKAIRLGVSQFWFGKAAARAATRRAHGIGQDRFVIVTVARITRRKGHHLTLAALNELPDEMRRRVTWLVIGPEGEADYVDGLRQIINVSDGDVRLLGPLPSATIRDLYHAADLFCLTGAQDPGGRVEGFGLVYLEAGACGLPSVATDVGGVSDAVLTDASGILVTPNVLAIAGAITGLMQDGDARARLASGASAHARDLSWERCAAETYGLPVNAATAQAISA